MRRLFISHYVLATGAALFSFAAIVPGASAQITVPDGQMEKLPEIEPALPDAPKAAPKTSPKTSPAPPENILPPEGPDYSQLPPLAERRARLEALFEKLSAEEDSDDAGLIAEEIWAIWLDSGSPSVNMLLRRGAAAESRADIDLARRMYDHVTTLEPDYAEGWARSARLAYSEDDLNRCVHEVMQALVLEPRQFYALWTLGNALEKLGRNREALEAYREAARLYPALKEVKDQVQLLENRVEGDVL